MAGQEKIKLKYMKIECKNFGPILSGSIEIDRDIIIFCGKNNSGKSYFSYLLYGLMKGTVNFNSNSKYLEFENISNSKNALPSDKIGVNFSINLIKEFAAKKEQISKSFSDYAKDVVKYIFPKSDHLNDSEFKFSIPNETKFLITLTQSSFNGSFSLKIPDSLSDRINMVYLNFEKRPNRYNIDLKFANFNRDIQHFDLFKEELDLVYNVILKAILFNFFGKTKPPQVRMFPSERIAIDMFTKDIVNINENLKKEVELISIPYYVSGGQYVESRLYSIPPNSTPSYLIPIQDSIITNAIITLYNGKKGELYKFGEEIENSLLDGKIVFEANQILYKKNQNKSIEIQYSSSMVKSLASIVLYFKYVAKKGDILIIDEPELCLSPTFQRQLAVLFAKVSHSEVQIIISTHSDFIVREFNNLIMLNQDSEEAKKLLIKYGNIGYSIYTVLDYHRIGVNVFQEGSITSPNVTETGFEIEIIDTAINEQNQISEDIYFTLF